MKELNQIDEKYDSELEAEDKKFSEGLKVLKGQEKKDLEKKYGDGIKRIAKESQKETKKVLKKNKDKVFEKEDKDDSKKNIEKFNGRFKVKSINMKQSLEQRMKSKEELMSFNFKLKVKNFVRKIIPLFAKLSYYEMKFNFIRFFIDVRFFITRSWTKTIQKFEELFLRIKDFSLKIILGIKNLFEKILNKVLHKKSKEGEKKEGEKSEEAPLGVPPAGGKKAEEKILNEEDEKKEDVKLTPVEEKKDESLEKGEETDVGTETKEKENVSPSDVAKDAGSSAYPKSTEFRGKLEVKEDLTKTK